MAISFKEYLDLHQESWLHLQKTTPKLLSYEDKALYSTWDLSFIQVKKRSSAAANLLRLWAYFDNKDIWFELLQSGREGAPVWFQALTDSQASFNGALRVLCDDGLVEANSS